MERKILHYDLVEKLGFGGAGEVYKAIDTRLGRTVALKFINQAHGGDRRVEEMLVAEARTASRLDHPNIGTIFEIGQAVDGQPFMAMAYYEGKTLQHILRTGPLAIDQATAYAKQMAQGLAFAHEHGVTHGDIKPSNVMVTSDGVLKIIDFGLARVTQDPELTLTLGFLGTPAYMSPERATGLPPDQSGDIWAWGLVIYEMLTGTQPYIAPNLPATLYAIVNKTHEAVNVLQPDTPPVWAALVTSALEKDPARRLPSMTEALQRCKEPASYSTGGLKTAASPSTKAADESREPQRYAVAVLPLKNLSGNESGEMFSEGLSEELINSLAKLNHIRLLARTSTFQFRGDNFDPQEIRRRLGATHVIDGSVRRQGDRVRIMVRLTDTELESVEWSERYDRLYDDIFAIQDEIGTAVAHVLNVTLNESAGRGARIQTKVPGALDVFLRGRYQLNRSNPVELGNAVRSFEELTRMDPNFALGYSNLAITYLLAAHWNVVPLTEARVRAKVAAQKALELDPDLAEAHAAMAAANIASDWSNFQIAATGFERAIELNPSYAAAYFYYGQLILRPLGRMKEALAASNRAIELDPLSPAMRVASAYAHFYSGNLERAIEEAQKSLEVDPNYIEAAYLMGLSYIAAGKPERAVELMTDCIRRLGPSIWHLSELGLAHARLGNIDEARAILSQIEGSGNPETVPPMAAANICIALREFVKANYWLDRAFALKDYRMLALIGNPVFPEVFTLPEFAHQARRLREVAHHSMSATSLSATIPLSRYQAQSR